MKIINGKLFATSDADWADKDGNTLAVWPGTLLKEEEYPDFVKFFKEELGTQVEVIGSYTDGELECVMFTCLEMAGSFPIQRLQMGIRWWFDVFAEVNGGKEMSQLCGIGEIMEKVGLEVI